MQYYVPADNRQSVVSASTEKIECQSLCRRWGSDCERTVFTDGKLFCGHCGSEMVADGGTGKQGKQHHYYTCKKRRKHECTKRRENKNALEEYVVSCVVDFLSDEHNAKIAVTDVLSYYEKRTDETN